MNHEDKEHPNAKKYIVRLSDSERKECEDVIKKLKGTSQKVRQAHILLKADADGPAWNDAKIADTFNCRTRTIGTGSVEFENLKPEKL